MSDLIQNYLWVFTGLFAVWVFYQGIWLFGKQVRVLPKVLIVLILVNASVFMIPNSVYVLVGVAWYPLLRWSMKRNYLPTFELIGAKVLFAITLALALLHPLLLITADSGHLRYFLLESGEDILLFEAIYLGAHILGLVSAKTFRRDWVLLLVVGILLLFTTNAYVFSLTLLPLLLGYTIRGLTASHSKGMSLLLLVNAALLAFYYGYVSVFTISAYGHYYSDSDGPWVLGLLLSPMLFGQGSLVRLWGLSHLTKELQPTAKCGG